MKKMILFVCLSMVFASIMGNALSDDEKIKEDVRRILLLESDVVDFENPPQSKEDALRKLAGNDTEKMLKIVDILKDFIESGYKCKENKEPKWLVESAIYCLGELRCKSALELLHKVLRESKDENMKYDCAQAILQIEDDPVKFVKEVNSGKYPGLEKYRYTMFEHFLKRIDLGITKNSISQNQKEEYLSFLKETFFDVKVEDGILIKIDKLLRKYDKAFVSEEQRIKALDSMTERISAGLEKYRKGKNEQASDLKLGRPIGLLDNLASIDSEKSLKIMEKFFKEAENNDVKGDCAHSAVMEMKNPMPFIKNSILNGGIKSSKKTLERFLLGIEERIEREKNSGADKNSELLNELLKVRIACQKSISKLQ